MNISAANTSSAPDKVVLNATPAGEQEIQFRQGEILKGVVQGVRPDGTIALLINDKLVNAVSEDVVYPGWELRLLVDGFRNGVTYLKVITEQEQKPVPLSDAGRPVDPQSVGETSQADTVLIVRALLQRNLPATPENVAEIINAANMVGGINARSLDAAVFALENNIPIDKNIFPALYQFICSDGDLSRLLQELIQILSRMESVPRPNSFPAAAPAVVITSGSSTPVDGAMLNPTGTAAAPHAAANTVLITAANTANIANLIQQGAGRQSGNTPLLNSVDGAALNPTGTAAAPHAAAANAVLIAAANNANIANAANIIQQGAGQQSGNMPLLNSVDGTVLNPTGTAAASPAANAVLIAAANIANAANAANLIQQGAGQQSGNMPFLAATQPTGTTAVNTGAAEQSAAVVPAVETAASNAANNVANTVLNNALLTTLIAAKPISIGVENSQTPVDVIPAPSGFASSGVEKSGDFTELLNILQSVLDSSIGKITGSGAHVNPVLQNMVKERALLLDNLRALIELFRADALLNKSPAGQELLNKISDLQHQITGQTVFNNAAQSSQNVSMNDYYFSFPVEIDNHLTCCQLRIQKKTGSRLEEQDNIKLVVSLDTPSLGIVMFHIDWHRQGYIQLQGVVETDAAGGFIKENIGELILKLGELGYKINDLGMKVSRKPEELNLKPVIKESEQGKIGPSNIDILA